MDYAKNLSVAVAAFFLAACADEVPCLTTGAVKTENGCECPPGTRLEENLEARTSACVEDAGVDISPSGAEDSGPTKRDAGSIDAASEDGAAEQLDAEQVDTERDAETVPPEEEPDSTTPPPDGGPACEPMPEECDGKDQDCDGVADNGLTNACGAPCGQVVPPEDCGTPGDDNCDGQKNEGCMPPPASCVPVAEKCDGEDQDCDGVPDNGVLNVCKACGEVPVEECNGMDDDCDGTIDDGVTTRCWADPDGDGYAAAGSELPPSCGCERLQTAQEPVAGKIDCAPSDSLTKPGASELCDGKDNDCDGQVDEDGRTAWYRDCDGDGFAASTTGTVSTCAKPQAAPGCVGWTERSPEMPGARDCDDADAARNPGASFGTVTAGNGDLNCDGETESKLEFVASNGLREGSSKNYPLCVEGEQTDCTGCYVATAIHYGFRGIGQEPRNKIAFISYVEGPPPCADDPATVLIAFPMTTTCGLLEQPVIALRNLCR